jgi:hypothetical protein
MYQKTFHLTQHTPLIHFQHDQVLATLRATEVKPKLDRFALKKLGRGSYREGQQLAKERKWLVGSSTALNYRLIIQCVDSIKERFLPISRDPGSKWYPNRGDKLKEFVSAKLGTEVDLISPSPLFANEDKFGFQRDSNEVDPRGTNVEELKLGVLHPNGINITVVATSTLLLKFLIECMADFFVVTNFGMRSTKGFGSFTIAGLDNDAVIKKAIKKSFSSTFQLDYSGKGKKQKEVIADIFRYIQEDHRRLKSGQSFGGYRKAQTFQYALNQANPSYRWDKRYLKGKIANNKIAVRGRAANLKYDNRRSDRRELTDANGQDRPENFTEQFRFIRALLGLAEQYEFQTDINNTKYKVRVKHKTIQRYASPIIWKVIRDKLYLLANDPHPDLLNETFFFDLNLDGSGQQDITIGSLQTPSQNEFNMQRFLTFALDNNRHEKDAIHDYIQL